jgi:hypothetical protein
MCISGLTVALTFAVDPLNDGLIVFNTLFMPENPPTWYKIVFVLAPE